MSATAPEPVVQPTLAELVKLCAVDTDLFGRTFFPHAMRDASPAFDKRVWAALENPHYRFTNIEAFRGSAKTTKLRIFTAKRIAYGISRTVLYVGPNEGSAVRSLQWLRSSLEPRLDADGVKRPSLFAQVFGLSLAKVGDDQLRIVQRLPGAPERNIWVLAVGITGTVRGINFDDYRPDLIVLDDLMTDENSQTTEQCEKITNLVMGALVNSLAPATEEPNAKIAHLCTPLDPRDVSAQAKESSDWHTESFGCWTEETADLPIDEQVSAWPSRYPTETLRKQKRSALEANRYSTFAREMECKLVSSEKNSFRPAWVHFYEEAPEFTYNVLAVDPAPPPSDKQREKKFRDKDYEAMAVVGRRGGYYYLLEYWQGRGHEPTQTLAKFFELAAKWQIGVAVVESIAYQRALKWMIEKEMQRRGVYYIVKDTKVHGKADRRPKFQRIVDSLSGPASSGHFKVRREMPEFLLQFQNYGIGYRGPDDLLEAVAVATGELTNAYLERVVSGLTDVPDNIVDFPAQRFCP